MRTRVGKATAGVLLGILGTALGADVPGSAAGARSVPAAAERSSVTNASRAAVTWHQLGGGDYPPYLERLRAAGCPEDKIRMIVMTDADEWMLQQRVAQAVAGDFAWWKAEPTASGGDLFSEKLDQIRKRRLELVRALLGSAPEEKDPSAKDIPVVINLGGPVLGALTREKFNAVQEICGRSMDRQLGYYNNRQNEGVFLNQGDLARLREQTRSDLSQVLSPEELEEFLLRYSHNSSRLRQELGVMEPTADEFRGVFRAVDALEHRLQLEFGAVDSLSARQREEYERQREDAIKKILPLDRYQRYLVGRYPLFRQAQLLVRRAGLPERVTLSFYEVLNEHESRRREILNNTALSAVQRQTSLQTLERDKETALLKALGEEGYKQYRDSLVN